eukprot:CAMPEP_0172743820 /NCGR_PEP_ID=MMETSP1074-20121228/133294_1 /TAXON_ID=2916 /ORGANISM="Ceratium fusus, Strain PA161109" /LENGTH=95 /DNA_ID=CAMNT_0013574621 /DNA_START=275 /DNA_END=560 /DNA_ORIENTATION=-
MTLADGVGDRDATRDLLAGGVCRRCPGGDTSGERGTNAAATSSGDRGDSVEAVWSAHAARTAWRKSLKPPVVRLKLDLSAQESESEGSGGLPQGL